MLCRPWCFVLLVPGTPLFKNCSRVSLTALLQGVHVPPSRPRPLPTPQSSSGLLWGMHAPGLFIPFSDVLVGDGSRREEATSDFPRFQTGHGRILVVKKLAVTQKRDGIKLHRTGMYQSVLWLLHKRLYNRRTNSGRPARQHFSVP